MLPDAFSIQHTFISTSSSSHTPHLIVGAGLAGCLLAWRLQQAGQHFLLLGSTAMPAAFKVAAGVINPVTGRWMTKTWNFDQLLPEAQATYQALEQQFGIQVFHRIPEVRFCQNADDIKRLGRRLRNPRYHNVLSRYFAPGEAAPGFNDPHGSFGIEQAAYIELPKLVTHLRTAFAQQGLFRDETFHHSALQPTTDGWQYQDLYATKVIFCEGAAAMHNPWFPNIALQPAKGETLLCHSPTLQLPHKLYHHKKWLLPYPDGSFRVGATYDEADLSETPTAPRKAELLAATHAALKESHRIEITTHLAGVRPSTRDSRPIIGAHPSQAGLYLLNGLGSKGASTAPAMSQQLVNHLLTHAPIDTEVDLARLDTNACA
ncbi:FAD-dependent oxidoreductase [Coraliomargarita sp. SDUM461004]|uniref:FAD-dependent oxidoreductase n=1 Tax=Thalassobacterium sedimentorum TaxID=3041258 RepID=A0ABU1AI65_9BACT|nr:FAD-dependent oxidoreductase [Coraliomargarita sp. SDUM461004]MDQ8194429.1 FAD-dependent oxidoreductase [Coraliomargarita sp. SDUM461004]